MQTLSSTLPIRMGFSAAVLSAFSCGTPSVPAPVKPTATVPDTGLTVAAHSNEPTYASGSELDAHPLAKEVAQSVAHGDLSQAIHTSQQLNSQFPGNPIAMTRLSRLYGKVGNFAQQVAWATQAMDQAPEYLPAYMSRALGEAALHRETEAKQTLNAAARMAPGSALPFFTMGLIHQRAGRFGAASQSFARAAALDPKDESALFHLAAMYAHMSRYDDSIETLERLLFVNPEDTDARRKLAQVRQLRAIQNSKQRGQLQPPQPD